MIGNGHIFSTSAEKALHFNQYFVEQSTLPPEPAGFAMPPLQYVTASRMSEIIVHEDEVMKVLKKLDITKANGPDGISNKMLKESAPVIATPLCKLFNKSLKDGKCPSQWKKANITPVYKKNNKQDKTNYRPISLLSCLSKTMEKLIFRHLYEYFSTNGLLTWRNSGFKPSDSTINQLIFLVHQIYEAIENGKEICLVFLDVSKAFDMVYMKGLLHKLQCMGIEGNLLKWI